MNKTDYNPDILSCLASLSNDEVFTPPKIVNEMLDLLPPELWKDKNARFLDPVSKTGIYLREIAKRLMKGLEKQIPNRQKRVNHILTNQLYGVAITELTSYVSRRSLYCSKTANGNYSVSTEFKNKEGNIRFKNINHEWVNGGCIFCGASKEVYDRGDEMESHAYEFIHTEKPEEIFKMKFDVILGNPPYQLSDEGHGRSARPVYHKFVQQAKKLNPRFLTMIIPARWYAGGKGLDEFRSEMLNDKRIRNLVDFENSRDVFPGVDVAGGICYFLWDRDNKGSCEIKSLYNGAEVKSVRALDEFSIFVRQGQAIPIIRKIEAVKENNGKRLSDVVSSRKPFGLPTNYEPKEKGVPCWFIQRVGLKYADKRDIMDPNKLLNKWKFLVPKAPIAGQTDFSKPVGFYYDGNTKIAKPGECCTESFIVAGAFNTEEEVISFKSYLFTKIVRFLILQTVISQDVTKNNFSFVPDLGKYKGKYTDELLRKRWNITDSEWNYIDSRIRSVDSINNKNHYEEIPDDDE
ncbi:Eco57I restriction-modification methylase domain-containing protein [Candidatus Woesearchaeota archaeon]|nr:Eco57I restriction-modification methylase domain-containing protein [Candidatus Woesearchaeota archaeon]